VKDTITIKTGGKKPIDYIWWSKKTYVGIGSILNLNNIKKYNNNKCIDKKQ
jgi:hypothetical protein